VPKPAGTLGVFGLEIRYSLIGIWEVDLPVQSHRSEKDVRAIAIEVSEINYASAWTYFQISKNVSGKMKEAGECLWCP